VASSIADRLNIDKADILNPESGENAAVKLALAETHIIQDTKAYFEAQGVLLSSFSTRARSDTIILVKNIPYGTTADQIREMFEPHGDLNRVLVPPAGTMAVVEFEKPDEAAKALRAVAYRRLGNSVVYLEKGPLGMFEEGRMPDSTLTSTATASPHAITVADQVLDSAVGDAGEEPSITGGSTLYIKNLSFSTTQERLMQIFRHLPSFSFARVQTKPDPKRLEGPRLSMGYGFVGFKDVESAKKALKSMQGFVLDGHALHVKFAGRGVEEERKAKDSVKSKSRTTKMIVKNVPFEATKKDIRELFGSVFLILICFFLADTNVIQIPWPSQIRTPPEEIRHSHTWIRIPRVCVSHRSRERIRCAATHSFAWPTSGPRMGRGSRAGPRSTSEESWRRIWRRKVYAREEAEA
jgi:multiple RNA-binding domain-containing protein 1